MYGKGYGTGSGYGSTGLDMGPPYGIHVSTFYAEKNMGGYIEAPKEIKTLRPHWFLEL